MAIQILARFTPFTWEIPCPPPLRNQTSTSVVLKIQRDAAITAWPGQEGNGQGKIMPLLKYAAALHGYQQQTPASDNTVKHEYALTLHALAYRYRGLADREVDREVTERQSWAVASLRTAQLAHDAYLKSGQPLPWTSDLLTVLNVQTRAFVACIKQDQDTELKVDALALGIGHAYSQIMSQQVSSGANAYARAANAYWHATALNAMPVGADAHRERMRRHHTALTVVAEAARHIKVTAGAMESMRPLQSALTILLDELDRMSQEETSVYVRAMAATGVYLGESEAVAPLDVRTAPLVLPQPLELPILEPSATFQVDDAIQREADAWCLQFPPGFVSGSTRAGSASQTLNSVLADLARMSEVKFVESKLASNWREQRTLLLGAMVDRLRMVDTGAVGLRDEQVIKDLRETIQTLQGIK